MRTYFKRYEHHGNLVWVREDLEGRHRDYCLCSKCVNFKPDDRDNNCSIANVLYKFCVDNGVTTPVWECPNFHKR